MELLILEFLLLGAHPLHRHSPLWEDFSSCSLCVTYPAGAFQLTFKSLQVPETKGLTLEEMDEVFGDSAGLGKADIERQHDIQRRLGLVDPTEKDQSSGSLEAEK
jgi:hypothetical protein